MTAQPNYPPIQCDLPLIDQIRLTLISGGLLKVQRYGAAQLVLIADCFLIAYS